MAYKSRVSDAVVRRLPMYYRHLRELEKAGVVRISSQELGERMNLDRFADSAGYQLLWRLRPAGLRLSRGQSEGTYRRNSRLKSRISCHHHRARAISGRAVANYTGFAKEGFNVQAMFDVSPALVGIDVHGILVQPMEKLDAWDGGSSCGYCGAGRSVCACAGDL